MTRFKAGVTYMANSGITNTLGYQQRDITVISRTDNTVTITDGYGQETKDIIIATNANGSYEYVEDNIFGRYSAYNIV